MQSFIDKIERDNPLSTDMEENWRYVWPRRWALLNAMVENFNSLQQLKAEIAAIADTIEECFQVDGNELGLLQVNKLRQLSAV